MRRRWRACEKEAGPTKRGPTKHTWLAAVGVAAFLPQGSGSSVGGGRWGGGFVSAPCFVWGPYNALALPRAFFLGPYNALALPPRALHQAGRWRWGLSLQPKNVRLVPLPSAPCCCHAPAVTAVRMDGWPWLPPPSPSGGPEAHCTGPRVVSFS